ncbi:MAG TPA: VOC family protein [Trebonia sp.]|jgi:catechol 2,3-dioxygenase-like lactoylglutathione lyase family enzyme|nr:VOC family protein [Trebonia sp.]
MNLSFKRVDVINLFAEDLAGTKSFYQKVLGLPMAFEDETVAVFKLENIIVSLTAAPSAPDLITPTPIADPGAGARFVLAMFVDDVDAACAELAVRGVTLLNGPVDRAWGMRTASFADPAGHVWEVSQDIG